tara:strand:- start:2010 stop:3053 length:1044 start_codon:yes stop_codon:yes gene_type:complete
MAGKKIWALAKDKRTSKYVAGTKHKNRLFYIWEALKLKDNDPVEYGYLEFMSTQRLEADRRQVHTHSGGFFRYNSNQSSAGSSDDNSDSDSLSHGLAIAALAELEVLEFKCGKETFSITPTSVETEQRLQLISEGNYKYYVPDLVFTFDDDSELAKRWGRKLAVEVMHTHACEAVKIRDFENHGIPIIEVKIGKMTLDEFAKTKSPNLQQMEDFYNYIKSRFSKIIYGTIISAPVTAEFYRASVTNAFEKQTKAEKQRDDALNEIKRLKLIEQNLRKENADFKHNESSKFKELKNDIDEGMARANSLKAQLRDSDESLSQTKKRLHETQVALKAEREKSIFDKLFKK